MHKLIYTLTITLLLFSCGGGKKNSTSVSSKTSNQKNYRTSPRNAKKIKGIIQHAKTFQGTRYKYGGTTKKGMDCSGLMYTSFKKEAIILPRTSKAMASQGKRISLKKAAIGDLLFFKTTRKNVISHVGLVVSVTPEIKFIHASTSKGVIISSLQQKYWNNNFAEIRRVF